MGWHVLVAFAATCATGFTPTAPWWASRTVDHRNGVRRRSAAEFLWLRHVQPASPSLIPARRHTHISTTHFDLSYVIISGNAANVVRNIAAAKKALEEALAL